MYIALVLAQHYVELVYIRVWNVSRYSLEISESESLIVHLFCSCTVSSYNKHKRWCTIGAAGVGSIQHYVDLVYI